MSHHPYRNSRGGPNLNPHFVAPSRHSIFIRGLPGSMEVTDIRKYFADESGEKCKVDFFSFNEENRRLSVALRFEDHEVARDMLQRFDGKEIFGSRVEITWFKDLRKARANMQMNSRFQNRDWGRGGGPGFRRMPPRGAMGDRGPAWRSRGEGRDRQNSGGRYDRRSHSGDRYRSESRSGSPSDNRSDRSYTSGSLSRSNSPKETRTRSPLPSSSSRHRSKSSDSGSTKQAPREDEELKAPRRKRVSSTEHKIMIDDRQNKRNRIDDKSPQSQSPRRPYTPPSPMSSHQEKVDMTPSTLYRSSFRPLSLEKEDSHSLTYTDAKSGSSKRSKMKAQSPFNITETLPTTTSTAQDLNPPQNGKSVDVDDVSKLSVNNMKKAKTKKEEIQKNYRKDCETCATVVKLLISKDASLEPQLVPALKDVLRDMGQQCIEDLRKSIMQLAEESDFK